MVNKTQRPIGTFRFGTRYLTEATDEGELLVVVMLSVHRKELRLFTKMLTKPIRLPFVKVRVREKAFVRMARCRTPATNKRRSRNTSMEKLLKVASRVTFRPRLTHRTNEGLTRADLPKFPKMVKQVTVATVTLY